MAWGNQDILSTSRRGAVTAKSLEMAKAQGIVAGEGYLSRPSELPERAPVPSDYSLPANRSLNPRPGSFHARQIRPCPGHDCGSVGMQSRRQHDSTGDYHQCGCGQAKGTPMRSPRLLY